MEKLKVRRKFCYLYNMPVASHQAFSSCKVELFLILFSASHICLISLLLQQGPNLKSLFKDSLSYSRLGLLQLAFQCVRDAFLPYNWNNWIFDEESSEVQKLKQEIFPPHCINGIPWWLRWQRICLQFWKPGFDPWVGKIPWRKAWQPISVFLPGESPWTEESGELQSMGLQRVGHD